MRSLIRLLALAFATLSLTCLLRAAELAGKWSAEFDTQIGPQKYLFEFKVDGEKLSGSANFENQMGKGHVELKDLKLKGDDISFVETLDMGGQELKITYTGKIAGEEMKLTRTVGDFGVEELVAKKAK